MSAGFVHARLPVIASLIALAPNARAQAPDAAVTPLDAGTPETATTGAPNQPTAAESSEEALWARIERLEAELREMRDTIEVLREDHDFVEQRVTRTSREAVELSGFVDVGFSWVEGDGSGIRSDVGYVYFPEYSGVVPSSWVFMGDPLSTMINARGEPADTGESRAITFDSVDSGGVATFLVNSLSLSLSGALSDELQVNAWVDFVPRRRDVSDPSGVALGDFIDVLLAYAEWRPSIDAFDLSLSIGKFDSVLGVEYRSQTADTRIEVTPSLICRYTCGRPIGLKSRARFLDDRALIVNLSVTNGSHFVEYFPFGSDVDTNFGVTGAARVSYVLPIHAGIEIGVSGAVGAQDLQTDEGLVQWHAGVDLLIDWSDFVFAAELVIGRAPGATEPDGPPCGLTPCLEYRGAYGRIGYRFLSWLLPFVRVDWREALHTSGASFVYVSEVLRITAGLRLEIDQHFLVKAEYIVNLELNRIPQFDDNVLTTSVVVRY